MISTLKYANFSDIYSVRELNNICICYLIIYSVHSLRDSVGIIWLYSYYNNNCKNAILPR